MFFQSNGLLDLCVDGQNKSFEGLDDNALDKEEHTDITTTRLSLVGLESASWTIVEQNDTLKRQKTPQHQPNCSTLLVPVQHSDPSQSEDSRSLSVRRGRRKGGRRKRPIITNCD